MNTVDKVITAHDRSYMSFLDSLAESGKVNLLDGPFVGVRTYDVAAPLLVVHGKVLHCGDDPLRLYAEDIRFGGFTDKIRIFSEVLKVPSAHRSTVDVDTRSEDKPQSVLAGIAPEALADASCQGSVPCCCGENPAWIHGALYIVAYALRAVGHFHFRQSEAWDRADGEVLIA